MHFGLTDFYLYTVRVGRARAEKYQPTALVN